MKRSPGIPKAVSTLLRFCFVAAFGSAGFLLGRQVDMHVFALHVASGTWQGLLRFGTPVVGALIGVGASPFAQSLFEHELAVVEAASERLSTREVAGGAVGLCIGLLVAVLLRTLLGGIAILAGTEIGDAITVLIAMVLGAFSAYIGVRLGGRELDKTSVPTLESVVDTSAIVDGRIVDVVRCGFLAGPLLVTRFVLNELQGIADSADPIRRARGRRGLELLQTLRETVEVVIEDFGGAGGLSVDERLVQIARERGARLVTTDYNLNRVASLEGVIVLNVNELAQALRPLLQAGQDLIVAISRDGREAHQGVGYLEDGTMIVVEGGRDFIGEEVSVQVTSVIQTAAGRMIFAKIR